MKNQRNTPPTHDIPHHVLEDILSRLPIKSLLRFKTVCKSWNGTIEDPGFATTHSKQSNVSSSQCFFADYSSGDCTYILMKFKGQEFYVESIVRFQSKYYNAYFSCCCEGILLFEHTCGETRERKFVLLNPFTRYCSTFSCPYYDEIHASRICISEGYGLCFDKYEDDHKFVAILLGGRYLVYSVKKDSWVERRSELRGYVGREGTYVNGFVYWVMSKSWVFGGSYGGIVYFDPKDDLLKKLQGPKHIEGDHKFHLADLGGNLCLYTRDEERVIEIWLLKEHEHGVHNRWMKLTTVDRGKPPDSEFFYAPVPLYLTGENEVVFQDMLGRGYAVYHPDKRKFGEVKKFPLDAKMIGFPCMESLHFPAIRRDRQLSDPTIFSSSPVSVLIAFS